MNTDSAKRHDRNADELEIRNTVARLAHEADHGSLDEYVGLFVDDGVWRRPAHGDCHTGHDELRRMSLDRRERGVQGPESGACHSVSTVAVEFTGADTAVVSSYAMFVMSGTNTIVQAVSRYEDHFVRTPRGWRVASRTLLPI